MLIEPIDDDPIRKYTDVESSRLTKNILALSERIRSDDCKTKSYSTNLICSWHRQLFDGVRDHAGRHRNKDYGEDRLTFGPNRSTARADVPAELDRYALVCRNLISELNERMDNTLPAEFVGEVIKAALYLHAELIRIHPFRDGNGRIGRLLMTFILAKFDIPPLVIEAPRQEYIDCINHYYQQKDIEPLYNLSLRIYNNQL
jgi:Fic family protein